ncbi:PREDICTED: von Willebrand factor C and EGF domain-containing protein [Calidris pugnax]|uniref:von Willebrand factor C and EGF domain-containing protein n=1 Tax=Calidris pugnax TaxID=198806 RepID=UPI00071E3579|nr:PREDICTED: von Willebrand factor C and EGF domain-containing protein [Calidris pugnax]
MLVELFFQAACVSLFLPGGQGRVYPGRKKPASFAVERRRVGPHVCFSGFGSGCCPGWMLAPGSGQCTLPLCSFGCGSGLCIAPNLCSCPDGEQGITCPEPAGTCGEYGCDLSCNHGGCQEVARVCPLGFSMVETANGIRCTDIDECLSAACEGLCVNTEGGFVCECGPGLQLSSDRHSCQDTDECLATPCQHRCQNSIGSYRCSCRPGYHLHGNRHSCVDVNECRRPGERRACQHTCHNTPGSYLCSCRPGYRLSGDRVSCEGYPKSILAPSPILQSLQHPPTLLLLPPGSGGTLLVPRGSPSPHLPAAAPGTQFPSSSSSSSPTSVSPATELSPGAVGAPNVNECRRPGERRACQHTCHNTPGSYLCSCRPGYRLSGDRVSCEGYPKSILAPSPILQSLQHPPTLLLLPPGSGGTLLTTPGCFVDDNGVEFPIGQIWSPGDPCELCICQADGSVSCKRTDCVETCPYPIRIPGQCCPDCSAGCTYMGRIFYNNETFPSVLDPCLSCICLLGSVACSPVDCAIFCTYPFHPEGECCPVCKGKK